MNESSHCDRSRDEAAVQTLLEIARLHGTPTYAFDLNCLRTQVEKLRSQLPAELEILYSLKANASLGICDTFAQIGLGADVASAGELATAVEAGFAPDRIFVAGPFKSAETIAELREMPEAIVSVDSLSELEALVSQGIRNRLVLRLRPDFGSAAVVTAGRDSRFGFTFEDLERCREFLDHARAASMLRVACADGTRIVPALANVIGFHVFAGSQVLKTQGVIEHLQGAFRLSLRAADTIGITPVFLNLGGGFGIPYGAGDKELDLVPIGQELSAMIRRMKSTRFVIELGRYLVAQAGWYLTSVLGYQTHHDRPAVVVDGGTHQRADICGLCLRSNARPLALNLAPRTSTRGVSEAAPSQSVRVGIPPRSVSEAAPTRSLSGTPVRTVNDDSHSLTDVLGCLSLPADVLAESSPLPPLERGDVLAFPNAGAYGLWSSPALFHGSPLPAEVAFDGSIIHVLRARQSARSILHDQRHIGLTDQSGGPRALKLTQ